ncbi:hypothetical protein [Ferrimonas sp. SCSIO 43195]|uniref:hypothetical protein n=1 Tax=Ferrimonas sp. SCSIO 43195 TaxID=2822844 RepID=UPI0020755DDE|nr:hypothetical protein [Ferrimonas sp. SCSIO 43195]USD35896.1 hypothetical protein J8Z22_12660 [Ferrimonas sp. SCSIO 43195]
MKPTLLLSALLLSGSALAGNDCTGNDVWVFENDTNKFGGGTFGNCGAYPADESLRVVTYTSWADGEMGQRHLIWRVLLTKADKPDVVASATLNLWEGPNMVLREEVEEPLFFVDKANYPLNASTNAFAVRADLGPDSYCRDVSRDQFVTLFVRDGRQLKPVLKHLPLKQSLVVEGSPCSRYDYSKTARGEGRLTLLDTVTNGYRDLKFTTTAVYESYDELSQQQVDETDPGQWEASFKPETRQFDTTLKFDGHRYPVEWQQLPSKAWWQQ